MPDQDDKSQGGSAPSSDSIAARMAKKVDPDKYKAFSQGFEGAPQAKSSGGMLDAMKRRMMGDS